MSDTKATEKAIAKAEIPKEIKAQRRMRIQEFALPVVLLILFIFGATYGETSEAFLSNRNLLTVLTQASVVGIIAVGMTFVIATGGIDLSVGSVLAVAGIMGGLYAESGELAFMAFAIGSAALFGVFNGFAIAYGRLVPFIVTLATLTIGRGVALNRSESTPISISELPLVLDIGTSSIFFDNGSLQVGNAPAEVFGFPIPALIFLIITALGWVLLNRTRYGRYVVAVGGNKEAARIAGIKVKRIIFSVYVLVGVCTGISAILITGRLASASPVAGTGYELEAIAAVVIGGTSLVGGRATMVGTFLGVLTFALVFNLLNLLNMPTELQQIVRGAIVLAAVAVQRRDK